MRFRFIWDLFGFFAQEYYNFKSSLPCQVFVSPGYLKFKLLVKWLCSPQCFPALYPVGREAGIRVFESLLF